MNQSSWSRWSLLSGILFVILYVIVSVIVLGEGGYEQEAEEIIARLSDKGDSFVLVNYLGIVAAFFLLWFSSSLRGVLKNAGQDNDSLADIAIGGGVAGSVAVAVMFSSLYALAYRAGSDTGVGPDAATALYDLGGTLGGFGVSILCAAMVGATGLVILRSRFLPVWFGWISVVLAIGMLTPAAYVVFALFLLWVLVMSIWLYVLSGRTSAT